MMNIDWKMADGAANQAAPMDTKNFVPLVEKIKNSDADVVILNLFGFHQELAI